MVSFEGDQRDIGTKAARPEAGEGSVDLWNQLESSQRSGTWIQAWLDLLCQRIDGCRRGVLLVGPPDDGPFTLAAVLPADTTPAPYLLEGAEAALRSRKPVILPVDPGKVGATALRGPVVALPILLANHLHGVVVIEVTLRSKEALEALKAELRWGVGWLTGSIQGGHSRLEGGNAEQLELVLGLVATALEHDRFQGAVTGFATELASELSCERVSIGFVNRGKAEVLGMSHSARFSREANLVHAVEAAMDEALDQEITLVYPTPEESPQFCHAHMELSRLFEAQAVLTVPLVRPSGACGAITLERDEPFDRETIALVEATSALVGASLDTLRREDRRIWIKLGDVARATFADLIGPHHVGLKLLAGVVVLTLLLMLVITGTYRISADTVLEPEIRRAVVASFDGFIARAPVRAGDVVEQGQLLVALDDRDFVLERSRWESTLIRAIKQHRVALVQREAAEVEILAAAIAEAEAELARVEELLGRTELRAPFDGIVVAGDLTQRMGAPARRGEVLMEVAPLDSYRMYMKVDEREIDEVVVGQSGNLVLSSLPTTSFRFTVSLVTPVATAEDGRNVFRVEGRLEHTDGRLRPGMEGIAKIEVGSRRLAWVWFHDGIDWLRLKLWAWTP